jgi:hypothetical protein
MASDTANVQYPELDIRNQKHIECVLRICKENGQFYNPVYMHLNLAIPPLVKKQFRDSSKEFQYSYREMVRNATAIRQVYDTRGVLAVVDNKVVGFMLYQLQIKDSTPDAQLLYTIVDRQHRRHSHGSNMLAIIINRHMTTFEDGVARNLHEIVSAEQEAAEDEDEELLFHFATQKEKRSHTGSELVAWISCSIQRNESLEDNLSFYLKNGFTDKSNMPGWEITEQPDPANFKSVIYADNRTYAVQTRTRMKMSDFLNSLPEL